MDLWIGVEDKGGVRQVRLEGRLAAVSIAEFEKAARGLEPPVLFDLSQLLSTDEEGLQALRARREAGDQLIGVRPLIQHQLDQTRPNHEVENNR